MFFRKCNRRGNEKTDKQSYSNKATSARNVSNQAPSTRDGGRRSPRARDTRTLFRAARTSSASSSVDAVGREIVKGWINDVEARRKSQLEVLRRRGKGPPKKGQGKRSKR